MTAECRGCLGLFCDWLSVYYPGLIVGLQADLAADRVPGAIRELVAEMVSARAEDRDVVVLCDARSYVGTRLAPQGSPEGRTGRQ